MVRLCELREKEVINVCDGCRLGYVCDVIIELKAGKIVKIVVPGPAKVFGVFGREQEYHIPWSCIKKIGDDIIIVDIDIVDEKILVNCN